MIDQLRLAVVAGTGVVVMHELVDSMDRRFAAKFKRKKIYN